MSSQTRHPASWLTREEREDALDEAWRDNIHLREILGRCRAVLADPANLSDQAAHLLAEEIRDLGIEMP